MTNLSALNEQQKLTLIIYFTVVFVIVTLPQFYDALNTITTKFGYVASNGGRPTTLGYLLSMALFMVLIRFAMMIPHNY